MKKRLFGILLSLALILGLIPGMSLTAYAQTYDPASKYTDFGTLNTNNTVVKISEVPGYDWYVIANDTSTVTLLSKQSFGTQQFNSTKDKGNDYETSDIKKYVDGLTGEGKPLAGISSVISDLTLIDITTAQGLSVTKRLGAGDTSWWLCSPGSAEDDVRAAFVHVPSGEVSEMGFGVNGRTGVRPALQLDLTKVIFDADAKTFTLKPPHTHSWTDASYSASGNVITATCQGTVGTCDLIGDKQPKLTLEASGKIYDGSVVTATASGNDTWTTDNGLPDISSSNITYSPEHSKNAGIYEASYTVGNATATQSFTITPKEVGLTWGTDTFTYDGDSHAPEATATNLVSGDTCNVTVDGAQTNAGSYTATAGSLSNSNYKLPSANTKDFTINEKQLTLTGVTANSKVYDGNTTADLNKTDPALDGRIGQDDVSIGTITGVYTGDDAKNVGTGKPVEVTVALTGEDADNYEVTPLNLKADITAKPVTVSGITAADKDYDGTTNATVDASNAVFGGIVGEDKLSITATGAFEDASVGEDKTVNLTLGELGGDDEGNYSIKDDSQTTTTAAITAKEVSVTAEDKSKTYGDTDPELTYTADGLITGDTFTGALTREVGEDAGNYDINQGTLSAGDNYAIKYTEGTFTINKATTNEVTASIEGWTYGDNSKNPNATATYGRDAATFTYSNAADGTYTEKVPTDAGTWYVKATIPETANYVGAVSDPVEFTIAKKEVGLEWTDTELTYNGKEQKPKARVTNLEEGDVCTVTVEGEQTDANAKTGTEFYEAEATKLSNPNYKLPAETKTKFTIAPKELAQAMISLDSDTFKHDGTEKSPVISMADPDILEDDAPKQMKVDEDYTLSGDVSSSDLGTHFITAKGEGNYTGTIDTSWMIYNNKSGEDKEEGTDGKGDFEVFVDIENNTSTLTVDNLNISMAKGFLTEEDMARYNEGESVLVYMIFKEQPESEVESTDSSLLGGLFRTEGATDISWYDITVWKKIGNNAAVQVHDTIDELSMSVEVPDAQKEAPSGYTREFYLGRAHDDIASILANTSKVKVGFSSSKFSTYALAYKDTKIPEPDPDDSDTGDNGNGSSSSKGGAKTGDSNDIAGLLALMLASGGALGAIGYRRRKETDK